MQIERKIGQEEKLILDTGNIFEAAVGELVKMKRRKGQDYDRNGDIFTNFRDTAEMMEIEGFGVAEAILFNIAQKISRLRSLRRNGKLADPTNETAVDTQLDIAVYAVILLAYVKREEEDAKNPVEEINILNGNGDVVGRVVDK